MVVQIIIYAVIFIILGVAMYLIEFAPKETSNKVSRITDSVMAVLFLIGIVVVPIALLAAVLILVGVL